MDCVEPILVMLAEARCNQAMSSQATLSHAIISNSRQSSKQTHCSKDLSINKRTDSETARVTRNDSRVTATSQYFCRNVLVRGAAMSPQGHGHMRRQCSAILPLRLFDLQLMTKQHASPEPSHNHSSSSLCGPLDKGFRAKAKLELPLRQRKKRQERRIQTTNIGTIKGCAYRV